MAPSRKRLRLALPLATAAFAFAGAAAPAAASTISPQSTHSPGASEMTTLYWIGLVVAVLLVIAVNVALVYALRKFRAERGAEARETTGSRRLQLRVGGGFAVLAAVLLVLSIVFTDRARDVPATGAAGLQVKDSAPLKIKATGQQWLWRYDYPNKSFSYYKLVVPVDTTVDLNLVSTDVVHTWDVPQLAGKRDAVPGKLNHAIFRADTEGTYFGRSATFSGSAYAPMRTEVDVVSPADYEAFLRQQKADIQSAQSRVVSLIEEGKTP